MILDVQIHPSLMNLVEFLRMNRNEILVLR